jgi:hypothetical protein
MAFLALGLSAGPANQELNSAADALAKAGSDFLRSTGATPARGAIPVASANNTVSGKPAVDAPRAEVPFEGVFVGGLGEGVGELRARFGAGKVEWVEPGKRTWSPKVTNIFTFSSAAGQLTVARPGLAPLVYRIGEGRKSLAWESGDGKMVPKELKVTQP